MNEILISNQYDSRYPCLILKCKTFKQGFSIRYYPCPSVHPTFGFLHNNLSYPEDNHLKFMHKAKFECRLFHFLCSEVTAHVYFSWKGVASVLGGHIPPFLKTEIIIFQMYEVEYKLGWLLQFICNLCFFFPIRVEVKLL